MSAAALVAPLAAALALAVGATAIHRRLPPRLGSQVITVALGVVLLAAVPTLWLLSLSYVGHLPIIGGRLEWCAKAVGLREPVPHVAGIVALSVTAVGTWRASRVVTTFRRLRRDGVGFVEIAEHDRPLAFTLPGRAGHVVLSTGLVDLLDDAERDVVVAHERSHARHRHDRYVLTAQLADAVMPVVRPLARRLQFTLERWADEDAVAHCGDRTFVARTLGKVALHNVSPAISLSFAGLGVPARVAALLGPPPSSPSTTVYSMIWTTIGTTAALSLVQLHHVVRLVGALCPG